MKKVSIAIALAALCGLAANTFADVQNIRLSGDIRLRGYLLVNAGDDGSGSQKVGESSFVEQRTRVCVEADLEDHVLVVVTLKAESLWGSDNEAVHNSGGAGSAGFNGSINRGWDVGIDEAYVQLNEVFYSAATLKVGRQYLNYGHGLILSSNDQEYNYDAGRLVLDYYPLTIDLVGAEVVNNQSFGAAGSYAGSADLLFANARYEMTDSLLKDIEIYGGWLAQGSSGPISSTRALATSSASSPLIVGIRADMNLTEGLNTWAEAAYESGGNGNAGPGHIEAYLANAGLKFGRKDWRWSPVFNASYTVASGGGDNGNSTFRPWFDYADGYNGYLFAPALSNLQIFNAGASVKPWENTTLAFQGYYYLKVDKDSGAGSNPNIDFGGLGYAANAGSREVGWEFDSILGYDYSKDVRGQLVYAMFIPDHAFQSSGDSVVAHEVRAEVDVKF